jgi:hypothetical protein
MPLFTLTYCPNIPLAKTTSVPCYWLPPSGILFGEGVSLLSYVLAFPVGIAGHQEPRL